MTRYLLAFLTVSAFAACSTNTASANQPFGYGFYPFGFYQPYGVQYGTSVRTPPHFSVNPPVYYGARYARPYGLSPFASPPLLGAPQGFTGRLRSKFEDGTHTTPEPLCNPHIIQASRPQSPVAKGEIRTNPFVTEESERLAQKS